ncbi:MAG: hypothetical protein RIS70_853, partial [Planctomycetota bacterium]
MVPQSLELLRLEPLIPEPLCPEPLSSVSRGQEY